MKVGVKSNFGRWILTSSLKMTEQINMTCQSVYYHLHNIRQIRKFLTPASTKLLVQGVIMAVLTLDLKAEKRKYVSDVLKANGYTKTFLRNCQKPVTTNSLLMKGKQRLGVTEPIKRILNSFNVEVAEKPFQTLGHIFAKPKDPVRKDQRTDAI
ncbi:hypothetical protein pdam_00005537 [Pocillopora damicornis]|uniref:Uncharacterized protein n=1 Tax=Pocillopora damicornis TaxID=46731 RepID=A0A3M6TK86_POCDA|nr:hypothetical protein pdam_00005537 [Pocillopora damicornis]